jgi:2-iminobutanoate/2-iminopropanoate deaminase
VTRTLPILLLLGVGCASTLPDRQVIATKEAPAAIGPYAQAVRVGDTLYLAGQIPLDPATNQVVTGGIEAQTHRVMQNLGAVLRAAGFALSDAVQCQVFLSDLSHYAAMNGVYATYFPGSPPARAVVQVARLPRDVMVEIAMVAVRTK